MRRGFVRRPGNKVSGSDIQSPLDIANDLQFSGGTARRPLAGLDLG